MYRCERADNESSIRGAAAVWRCVQEKRIVRSHRKPGKLWVLIASKNRSPERDGVQIEQDAAQIISKIMKGEGNRQ